MTLLSRISGLVRDVIFANILGDKAAADVFFIAFRIPNFFRRIFGEGAFSLAFIPVFTDYRVNHSREETNAFLQILTGRFALVLLVFCALGVLFSPLMVMMLAAGFIGQPEKFDLAVQATRITFPYLFFISLVALASAMLNSCGRFAAPAATPILLNLSLISAAILLVPRFDDSPIALSWGVIAAGLVQLLFQIPFLRKEKLSIKPRVLKRKGDEVAIDGTKRVFRLTLPAVLGVSVAQINVIVNTILASFLVTGSISWLYYADRIVEFPLGVFGIALSTVILPDLSKKYSKKSIQNFSSTLDWAVRWVVLICIPATVGIVLLATPTIATIYFHGDFTVNGVYKTAASLVAYALGLTPMVLVKVLAPGFYARENTRTPVRIAMISMLVNIVFCLLLVFPLKHVGLALSTSLAAVVNSGLLYIILRRENVYTPDPGWLSFLFKVSISSAFMGMVLWWFVGPAEEWILQSIWQRVIKLIALTAGGGILYFCALLLLGIKPGAMMKSSKVAEL